MPLTASLLLLADSRLPAGGHAHSGGVEAATVAGLVGGEDGLDGFLRGRLATAGLAAAGLAAAACGHAAEVSAGAPARWAVLGAEAAARTPSPAQRAAAQAQGRALLRAARAAWPHPVLESLAASAGPGIGPGPARRPRDPPGTSRRPPGCTLPPGRPGCVHLDHRRHPGGRRPAGRDRRDHRPGLGRHPAARARPAGRDRPAGPLRRGRGGPGRGGRGAAARGDWAALPAPSAPGLDLLAERHAREEVALFES